MILKKYSSTPFPLSCDHVSWLSRAAYRSMIGTYTVCTAGSGETANLYSAAPDTALLNLAPSVASAEGRWEWTNTLAWHPSIDHTIFGNIGCPKTGRVSSLLQYVHTTIEDIGNDLKYVAVGGGPSSGQYTRAAIDIEPQAPSVNIFGNNLALNDGSGSHFRCKGVHTLSMDII